MKKKRIRLKYKPLPYLINFHNDRGKYFTRAIITGYGGGKTYAICHEFIKASVINRGIPNIIVEPTYQMVTDILEVSLIEILEGNNIKYNHNKSKNNFYFPWWNGRIWLRSGEKPKKLKGPNVGLVGIDEPFIQDEEVYKQMLARSRHPKAPLRGVVLTGTPENLNWGYDLIRKQSNQIKVYHGTTYNNTYLGEEYISNLLEHYSDKEVRAYINGEFVNMTTGLVYYPFSQSQNVISSFTPLEYRPLEISCDFNVGLMAWHIGQEMNGKDYTFDSIELEGQANTELMCQMLRSKYPAHIGGYQFFVDMAGTQRRTSATQTDVTIIQENFPGSPVYYNRVMNIKDRTDALNARLRNGRGEVNYFITSNCTRLIRDYERVTWEMLQNKAKADDLTHASDGESYRFYHKYPLIGKVQGSTRHYI